MKFLNQHKGKIISVVIIAILLAVTYFWGGNVPTQKTVKQNSTAEQKADALPVEKKEAEKAVKTDTSQNDKKKADNGEQTEKETVQGGEKKQPAEEKKQELKQDMQKDADSVSVNEAAVQNEIKQEETLSLTEPVQEEAAPSHKTAGEKAAEYSKLQGMSIDKETGMDKYETEPVPEGKPVPIEPQAVTISDKAMTCTLSIRCDALLDNMDYLDEAKKALVPSDGIILAEKQVTFYEGESVFNVLLRETRRNKIHMEYVNTPIYNSAYIEGIHNLYEFDCGELSGWMYSVNGWFPNYGCSRYGLKEGDRIEWVYTCNLGKNVE